MNDIIKLKTDYYTKRGIFERYIPCCLLCIKTSSYPQLLLSHSYYF